MTKSQRFLQQQLFSGDLQFCCACRHWCTAHLQTDSTSSYHCPAAMSRWCRTGKTSVLAHKLLISPSGSISCSPEEIRPQNTSQQPRTRCNSLAEAELHPCLLLFSSLGSKISSPPPLSFLHPPSHRSCSQSSGGNTTQEPNCAQPQETSWRCCWELVLGWEKAGAELSG